ncbi:MAG: alpha/beta hydrolase [Pseudomonadota bacterium]
MVQTPKILKRETKPDLAYVKTPSTETGSHLPTVMFLGGFRSDMEGTKALFLEEKCKKAGQAFIRFDYSGHGVSGGAFEEGCIGDWADDALAILDELTHGPVIFIGSSMGGWISLLLALKRPERVEAIIGLAAAPDFTKIMEQRMSDDQKKKLETDGFFALDNDYSDEPYVITKKLIEDGRAQCLLDETIDIQCPVRLIQGKKDTDVNWKTAEIIQDKLLSEDVDVILLYKADHRLSAPNELVVLSDTLDSLI